MITIKICPRCGSEDVVMIAGGITGAWMCRKCGYQGSVLEKEITGREIGAQGKNARNKNAEKIGKMKK